MRADSGPGEQSSQRGCRKHFKCSPTIRFEPPSPAYHSGQARKRLKAAQQLRFFRREPLFCQNALLAQLR
jgi:hypothetical protein